METEIKLEECPYCKQVPEIYKYAENYYIIACEMYACNNPYYAAGSTPEITAHIWNEMVAKRR